LLRSRYAAYALNLPDFIIETTHPSSPEYSEDRSGWRRSLGLFSRASRFEKLEIRNLQERGRVAAIVFTAHVSQQGKDATFTEKSFFEKVGPRWLYRGGQVTAGAAPNLITNHQLRLLPLAYYGDPVLRRKGAPVTVIDDDLKQLIEEMIETMDACDGVGLAAPQVHHSLQLFVIRAPVEKEGTLVDSGEPRVFINPILLKKSREQWEESEGCLSIPLLRAQVKRPETVTVEYTDLEGCRRTEEFSGWAAKIIQHEYDHIEGILFIDHLDSATLQSFQPLLAQLEAQFRDHRAL
jgi:peptide deformylase